MSTTPIPIPPDIGRSAGPLLLGYLFNWGLYGVLSVQVYLYYIGFPKDRLSAKLMVAGIIMIETLQTILVTHDVFNAYAAGFGDLNKLNDAQLEWLATPIISGIVSCSVQIFFAHRIWGISGSIYIPILVTSLALMQGSAAIGQGVQAKIIGNFAQLQVKAKTTATVWLAGSAACDFIIALSMTYYVRISRKETHFKRTNAIINRLIRLTIETGSLTATVAIIDIILYLVFPHQDYHTAPALTLAKLYSNTLLVIFNSRLRIVGGRDNDDNSVELGSLGSGPFNTRNIDNTASQSRAAVSFIKPMERRLSVNGINIQKETWTDRDSEVDHKIPHASIVDARYASAV
ncbi:hypothetical protein M422DRAFT_34164 [Sphaerobolus stellatus SS14]|uniref:Unplaced genomic scaffold SPHSTscaffold_101, whole genome shotgun sequence n=1 Tax=Sphaerobolus stellatus (strain SS14) TaxID=990650 RepID=A0A0C9U1D9_SPHS4|nr:hypothetical protein M422DRAFT_34164 [Sphaerobolus stellatus SS14]